MQPFTIMPCKKASVDRGRRTNRVTELHTVQHKLDVLFSVACKVRQAAARCHMRTEYGVRNRRSKLSTGTEAYAPAVLCSHCRQIVSENSTAH